MTSIQKILACEAKQLRRFNLLSHKYKQAGWLLLAASAIVVVIIYSFDADNTFWRVFSQNVLLLSMLLVAVSRDKEEDEYTESLRMRSFMLALVCGVLYVIVQPYIIYFINPIVKGEAREIMEFTAFPVMFFILFVQIGFYYLLRATR